jgi:pyruvate,water dikinase
VVGGFSAHGAAGRRGAGMMDPHIIVPLNANVPFTLGGGKGANLSRLVAAGFLVPSGFIITTRAYQWYVEANRLGDWIVETVRSARSDDVAALDRASAEIRARFEAATMPPELADAIRGGYGKMSSPQVAVRSSATTEDLPEASFAGQQDTFLNVATDSEVVKAVVRCWSSLWTARAIGYRTHNAIEHQGAAVAVVVQEMVQSEVAGVLFTANPLTGKRTETVIDATFGLGEALVSGQVEPDHYVVDSLRNRILSKTLGAKAAAIRSKPEGGTETIVLNAAAQQALPDKAILELAALGRRAEMLFGVRQDIEWAWAGEKLYLLQSRPITSLFPVPAGMPPEPVQVLLSFGAFQGMLDPMTPLGRDVLLSAPANVSKLIAPSSSFDARRLFAVAAERLFINVTGVLRHTRARKLIRKALMVIEPGTGQVLESLETDLALASERSRTRLKSVTPAIPLLLRIIGHLAYNVLWPDAGRRRIQRRLEAAVTSFQAKSSAATTLGQRIALCDAVFTSVRRFAPVLVPGLAVGLGSLRLLHYLGSDVPGGEDLILETTRGLSHNVTTEMDLSLWQTAVVIRNDPAAAAHFRGSDVATLAAEALAGQLPTAAQTALGAFLKRYGMRGIAEIDLGRPRWRDDPTPLLQVLQSYLRIADPGHAPDVVFERGAKAAETTIAALVKGMRRTRYGWLKSRLLTAAARRMRALAGLRESPKFTAIRLLGVLREGLLESSRELLASGVLARPDDIFYLYLAELRALADGEPRDWRMLVAERRSIYRREMGRRQMPRVLLSDGRAFFEGFVGSSAVAGAALAGSAVSPGIVEGMVHVVADPHGVQLAPGEILVCRGTDPAWTPLFLAAGGLVMEVGGLMTHGSVVAREYGIPAVVGVHQATTRLQTGQRVRVDGSRGTITILGADRESQDAEARSAAPAGV